jgi:hypothetical protein
MIMERLGKLYRKPFVVLLTIYIFMLIYGICIDTPHNIGVGLKNFIVSYDNLVSDYIEIGGIGATLVNSSVISILIIGVLYVTGVKPNGSTIMSLWLITGFSMFGKNLTNIWPIIFGGWLHSKIKKESFLNYSLVTLLSTTLAPVISQISLDGKFSIFIGIVIGTIVGIAIGFIMPAISASCMRFHGGYMLYNVGFAGGILGISISSLLKGIGIDSHPQLLWNTTNSLQLTILLTIIFLFLIVLGIILGVDNKMKMKKMNGHTGRLLTDFYSLYGETAYINMGIIGLFSTILVLIIGSDINGATIAGIFTIVGFGAVGKHIKNIVPIMAGCIIGALISVHSINQPGIVLAILFGTCLAPLSATFGWPIGILAGILHVNIVLVLTPIHGGLNLYNNGLAGGFVAIILIPVITAFKRSDLD